MEIHRLLYKIKESKIIVNSEFNISYFQLKKCIQFNLFSSFLFLQYFNNNVLLLSHLH